MVCQDRVMKSVLAQANGRIPLSASLDGANVARNALCSLCWQPPASCLPEDEVPAAELEDEAEGVVADEVVAEEAGGARGRRGRGLRADDRSEELV